MKREHAISNPLVDFLQAHNCLFYSPLSHDDTTDWISGNQMMKYANDSVVWDSNLNMWKFTYVTGQSTGRYQYYAKYALATPIPINTRLQYTCLAEYYPYDSATWTSVLTSAVYDFLPLNYGMSLSGVTGQINQSAHVFSNENGQTYQKFYRDGVLVYNNTTNLTVFEDNETHVILGNMRENNMKKQYGVRNLALFMDVLTIQEINEYFNILAA